MTRRLLIVALGLLAACGPKKVAVDPAIAGRATLEEADANLRAGCFDCLAEALKQYESVRAIPVLADLANTGALRAAGLLALRERELGTTDSGYLDRARQLAGSSPALQSQLATIADLVTSVPWRIAPGPAPTLAAMTAMSANRTGQLDVLRQTADGDELSAYFYIAAACDTGVGLRMGNREMRAAVGAMADVPLVAYRLALCPTSGLGALDDIVAKEPRYKETVFYKAQIAVRTQKLDEGDARYRDAYAWRSSWPAATMAIADVAMTGEDFAGAVDFYERTLTLAPRNADATLGKLRALSYAARHQEALDTADELLARKEYPGDAYYWRAFNELNMERYDPAWTDIELADGLLVNDQVPKLAGIIAINRKEYEVARRKLETAQQRNPMDCQTGYFLHLVLTELRDWERAVRFAQGASKCFDSEIAATRDDIARIQASDRPEAKKARLIAGRQQRIATDTRMRANCWYNAAAASYNLSRKDDAKAFAERVVDDEQLGERAKELLARLR
jgi:tetratricopeptide (TPR) repeat protein